MSHKSWRKGLVILEGIQQQHSEQAKLFHLEPSLGGMSACLPLTFIQSDFFFFLVCLQYPELLVASYNNNEDAPHEPDGVALVWNMKYKKTTPEYVFHCQVLKATLTFLSFY